MPRKKKSQKQIGITNEPRADLPPPTINTSTSKTSLAQEERAISGKRSDGPTTNNQGMMTEQALALRLNELDHRANSNGRKQDSKTGDKVKVKKADDNQTSIEDNSHSISSTADRTNSIPNTPRLATPTWASIDSRKDEERSSLHLRPDETLKDKHEQRQNRDEGNPEKEAYAPLTLDAFKGFAKEERDRLRTKRAAQASQDKQLKIQSLKDFSKNFTLPTLVPRDLVPILAKERWKQDQILAQWELAQKVQEALKSRDEEKTSEDLQRLEEESIVDFQNSPSNSNEASDNATLSLDNAEDGQIESSNSAQGDVHDPRMKFGELSYDLPSFTASSVVFPDEPLRPDSPSPIPSLWPSESVRSPGPAEFQSIPNEAGQSRFHHLLNPQLIAFECGLGAIRHENFSRGTLMPFQTLKNLGRGSMAHVEEVNIPRHRSFVRKTFLLTMSSDLRLRCRDIIHQEIQVMSRLSHMHIVNVIGSYDLEPITSTILMFPVGDNDLKMFLDESLEMPPESSEWATRQSWLWKWVGCLTSAIAYIHSQGICHKDIKPSNIVHKGGNVYLTDFSSCGQFDIGGTTSTGADARTTLMYRAPELFRTGDAGKHGPGTDIFAIGLVFLEMRAIYCRTSIQRLRELYAAAANVKTADLDQFYYGKALIHIHEELGWSTHRGYDEAWPLSSAMILSMLASERKERPSAVQVLDANPWTVACSCVCTVPNATPDNSFSQSETYQETRSQVSDPSALVDPSIGSSHLPLHWRGYVKPTPLKPELILTRSQAAE